MKYEVQEFNIPEVKGLSEKQLEVHLGLYAGYVKHVNHIAEQLGAARKGEVDLDSYVQAEVRRRLAFEFDGMRMHEVYFEQLEGGSNQIDPSGNLAKKVSEKYGDVNGFLDHIKEVAGSRGIGWTVAYHDNKVNTVHVSFVADHEIGHLSGLPVLFALDMWEHAFMVDYLPSEKANYVQAFLDNTNWEVVEKRLS